MNTSENGLSVLLKSGLANTHQPTDGDRSEVAAANIVASLSQSADVLHIFQRRLAETEQLVSHLDYITRHLLPYMIQNR